MDFDEVIEMEKNHKERAKKPDPNRKTRRPYNKGSVTREVAKQGVLGALVRGRILPRTPAAAREELIKLGILKPCGQSSSRRS